MTEISKEIFEIVNKPGRVGVLGTADKQGQPNAAYFGSLRLMEPGFEYPGFVRSNALLKMNNAVFEA